MILQKLQFYVSLQRSKQICLFIKNCYSTKKYCFEISQSHTWLNSTIADILMGPFINVSSTRDLKTSDRINDEKRYLWYNNFCLSRRPLFYGISFSFGFARRQLQRSSEPSYYSCYRVGVCNLINWQLKNVCGNFFSNESFSDRRRCGTEEAGALLYNKTDNGDTIVEHARV